MITRLTQSTDSILGFMLCDKLHGEDHQRFVAIVETAIVNHGSGGRSGSCRR